jgi:hypothetical protein
MIGIEPAESVVMHCGVVCAASYGMLILDNAFSRRIIVDI